MTNNTFIPKIIFTDDDEDDISFFKEAIIDLNKPVVINVAKTYDQLFALLEKNTSPDFLFLDLNIPAIDGKEILHAIRSNKKYDEIKIIIYSTSKRDVKNCYDAGADLYLIKPDSINGITEVLKKILTEECRNNRQALRAITST
jgi:CheY-like chemotaxis protein